MNFSRRGALAALLLAAVNVAAPAVAQEYPSRTIRIVSSYGAGGPNDIFARHIAENLQRRMGSPVIVENRVGADGRIGAESVAKSAPDGYTLLMLALAHTAHPTLYRLNYDVVRDFAPISRVASVPLVLVVGQQVPATTTREFIEMVRARPGQINYASGGNGTSQHLAMEMFASASGLKLQHVAYRGLPPALTDMLNGNIQAMMSPVAFALQHIQNGRLRLLGITTSERSSLAPNAPTIAEAGVPGFKIDTWHGLVAPAGTPAAIVDRLNREIAGILADPAMKDTFMAIGAIPAANSSAEFKAEIEAEIAHWGRVIREARIEVQ